jgi:hypothetical protein
MFIKIIYIFIYAWFLILHLFNKLKIINMKKILLLIALVISAKTLNAQQTLYSASDSTAFSTWTLVDYDADSFNWGIISLSGTYVAQGACMISYSYDNATMAPLTPNNWAVSPSINLTGQSTATLSWSRAAVDSDWLAENYSVYVVQVANPASLVTALQAAQPVYSETIAAAGLLTRSVSISAFANMNNVYVAFRHHNCTDFFALLVDDVKITNAVLDVEENIMEVSVYPNPAIDELNINLSQNASSISIKGMDGKVISIHSLTGNSASLNISNLVSGVYICEVVAENGNLSHTTFIKK